MICHTSTSLTRWTRRLATLAFSALLASTAHAAFPDKPVKLIVPWAPGGSTDAIARAIAQRVGETLGQPVIVDNKPGAAGQIGTDAAAKAAADGYTISIVELPHAIAPAVVAKLPYDLLRDFTPITLVGTSPLVLFATPGVANDGKALLASARTASAKPLALAHSGNGTVSHLAAEVLAVRTGQRYIMVPYRGSAPALTDVAAGQVQGHFATMASGLSLLEAGRLQPMLVTSEKRMPVLPNVPTATELGLKDMNMQQWWAFVAPATTPVAVIEKLRTEILAAIAHKSVKDRLGTLAIDLKGSSRDDLRRFMRSEVDRWGQVAREAGLKPE
ncbi:MAG TPA: tripartite tricarboxylate transporter substrate-binding protein [Burkholderiaceae bacterium]|nr:tripartite tricarboxylate transporter substrate-binding protein [Burkholderiaceae bacterium]